MICINVILWERKVPPLSQAAVSDTNPDVHVWIVWTSAQFHRNRRRNLSKANSRRPRNTLHIKRRTVAMATAEAELQHALTAGAAVHSSSRLTSAASWSSLGLSSSSVTLPSLFWSWLLNMSLMTPSASTPGRRRPFPSLTWSLMKAEN